MTAAQKRVLRQLIQQLTRWEPDLIENEWESEALMLEDQNGRFIEREQVLAAIRSAHSND